MPAIAQNFILRRDERDQNIHDNFDNPLGGFFYTEEGRPMRYGVLLGILLIFVGVLIFSYQHATYRMNKGLQPLKYHAWLVSKKRRAQFESQMQQPEHNFSFYQQEHPLHAVPPPAYNPNYIQPPKYPGPPPAGTSKAELDQHYASQSYSGNGEGSSTIVAELDSTPSRQI